ncbi:MAG TPA: acyl carrier protein [Longimicrobiaceae bacterium]|jgi:acyl carrier protein|nr:acyl carrier protein [Longimicrobiaceae bacterium]
MRPELLVSRVFSLPAQRVDDDTSNTTVATWDSLAHINLLLEMETIYGVTFSIDEALKMTSVGSIKHVLAERGIAW